MLQMIYSSPSLSDETFMINDATTFLFNNRYFIDIILNGRGLLKIDSEISRDQRTLPYVVRFAKEPAVVF